MGGWMSSHKVKYIVHCGFRISKRPHCRAEVRQSNRMSVSTTNQSKHNGNVKCAYQQLISPTWTTNNWHLCVSLSLSVLLATCVFCPTTVGHGSWNGTPADLHDTLRLFVNVLLAVGHAIVSTH